MKLKVTLATAAVLLSAIAAQAQDNSAIVIGKSSFGVRCAACHGEDAKGATDVGGLMRVPPSDLTKLAEREGGRFPFADVYHVIVEGMDKPGHGDSDMPVWGDYFMADALIDRGVSPGDALEMAAGRILSTVYYLESIQE